MRLQAAAPPIIAAFFAAIPAISGNVEKPIPIVSQQAIECPDNLKGSVTVTRSPGETTYSGTCTDGSGVEGSAKVTWRTKTSPEFRPM